MELGIEPVIRGGTRVEMAKESHWTILGMVDCFDGIISVGYDHTGAIYDAP